MCVVAALSCIPIFLAAYLTKKNNGYSKGVFWFLFFLCGILYCVIKVFFQQIGIIAQGNSHIPLFALIIIFTIDKLFMNNNIPSYLDTDEEYQKKKNL